MQRLLEHSRQPMRVLLLSLEGHRDVAPRSDNYSNNHRSNNSSNNYVKKGPVRNSNFVKQEAEEEAIKEVSAALKKFESDPALKAMTLKPQNSFIRSTCNS